jgi:hypothetical protein
MLSSSVSIRETRGLLYQLRRVPRDSLGLGFARGRSALVLTLADSKDLTTKSTLSSRLRACPLLRTFSAAVVQFASCVASYASTAAPRVAKKNSSPNRS